jgi:hypothetical protein
VDEEALAAAASLLAETNEVQDEAVLAADGWTDSPSNQEGGSSENLEDHGFSEESGDQKDDDAGPSQTKLDDEEKGEESEE